MYVCYVFERVSVFAEWMGVCVIVEGKGVEGGKVCWVSRNKDRCRVIIFFFLSCRRVKVCFVCVFD